LRLYADDSMSQELMSIQTPHILDFTATYNVVDSTNGQPIGTVQRQGMKSILRDAWLVTDPAGRQGRISEDGLGMALIRRFVEGGPVMQVLAPQAFHLEMDGQTLATYRQNRNPIISKVTVDFSGDPQRTLDRRLGLAAGILLAAVEGRQG